MRQKNACLVCLTRIVCQKKIKNPKYVGYRRYKDIGRGSKMGTHTGPYPKSSNPDPTSKGHEKNLEGHKENWGGGVVLLFSTSAFSSKTHNFCRLTPIGGLHYFHFLLQFFILFTKAQFIFFQYFFFFFRFQNFIFFCNASILLQIYVTLN